MTLRIHPAEIVRQSQSPLLSVHPSWLRVPLGDIAEVRNGFAFKSEFFHKGEGVPLLRIRDVGRNFTETHYSGQYDPSYIVRRGEIVVGMDGDFRVARWIGSDALLNQRVCKVVLRDRSLYDEDLLLYVLPGYLNAIHDLTSSVTVKHLSSESIRQIPLPLPPLVEQHHIVAAIDEHFSRIDAGVEALRRARRNLQRMRRAVLDASLTGRLVPQDPDDEAAELLLKRIAVDRSAPKDRGLPGFDLTTLPDLPSGWTWCRAWQICDPITNGDTPPGAKMTTGAGEIPFIKIYNLSQDGQLDFNTRPTFISRATHESELRRSRILPGDVLINIVGPPLGKVAVVPDTYAEWNTNQAVVLFRPTPAILARLLAMWLLTPQVMRRLTATAKATAGQFNIALSACRLLPLPLPPLREQHRIVSEVERLFSDIASVELTVEAKLEGASRLRQALLSAALSGKLVPQDPSGEPAGALLERIAATGNPARRPGAYRRSRRLPS